MIMEPDIYTSITELAAVYETLNERLESDPCTTDAYQVCCQQTYRDAYAALQAMPVEPIALRLIAEGISDRVLIRLRDLIRKNIHICETRKEFSVKSVSEICASFMKTTCLPENVHRC